MNISEEEHEVVLHQERPVVEKEAGDVRLDADDPTGSVIDHRTRRDSA
jgi:hypothetical protein